MKQLVATKGKIECVMRLLDHHLFIRGMPTNQFYSLLANMKQKNALKQHLHIPGWVRLTFVDEIPIEGLETEFFETMVLSFKNMGFSVEVTNVGLKDGPR